MVDVLYLLRCLFIVAKAVVVNLTKIDGMDKAAACFIGEQGANILTAGFVPQQGSQGALGGNRNAPIQRSGASRRTLRLDQEQCAAPAKT